MIKDRIPVAELLAGLAEEAADVGLYLDTLDINRQAVEDMKEAKLRRWEKRLGEKSA